MARLEKPQIQMAEVKEPEKMSIKNMGSSYGEFLRMLASNHSPPKTVNETDLESHHQRDNVSSPGLPAHQPTAADLAQSIHKSTAPNTPIIQQTSAQIAEMPPQSSKSSFRIRESPTIKGKRSHSSHITAQLHKDLGVQSVDIKLTPHQEVSLSRQKNGQPEEFPTLERLIDGYRQPQP